MTTKSSTRFRDLKEAARFYGISRAQIMILRKLGTANGDKLPIDDPAAMVAWYERMQAKGVRRRACPDSVLARACEATAPPATTKGKRGEASTPPPDGSAAVKPAQQPAAPPAVKITLGEEASVESILRGQMQMYAGLSKAYATMIEERTQQTPPGITLSRQIAEMESRILAWQKAAADFRGNEQMMDRAEVQAAAMQAARMFFDVMRRELLAEFSPADGEKVLAALDRLCDRLPTLMPDAVRSAA